MANVRNMGSVATLGTKSITANGTYNASADNLDGFSQVSVNVPSATLGTKSITENGTYNASSDNLDGFSQVSVNVPEAVLGTKSITANGTYNASSDNLDGFSQVSVNVPSPLNKFIDYSTRDTQSHYSIESGGVFTYNTVSTICLMSFPVLKDHDYILMTGTNYAPNYGRYGYYQTDLVANPSQVNLDNYNTGGITSTSRYTKCNTVPYDGFLIVYIGPQRPNDIIFLLDVTGLPITGHIS